MRTPDSGTNDIDAAAWWLWTGIGLTMEPTTEGDLLVYDSLVLDKTLHYFWNYCTLF